MGARVGSAAVQLLKIDFDTYARFLMQYMEGRVRRVADELRQMPVLQRLQQSTIMSLAVSVQQE
eukprot:5679935-Prymnesium_polylepis.1